MLGTNERLPTLTIEVAFFFPLHILSFRELGIAALVLPPLSLHLPRNLDPGPENSSQTKDSRPEAGAQPYPPFLCPSVCFSPTDSAVGGVRNLGCAVLGETFASAHILLFRFP